jgi:hypothetical protein
MASDNSWQKKPIFVIGVISISMLCVCVLIVGIQVVSQKAFPDELLAKLNNLFMNGLSPVISFNFFLDILAVAVFLIERLGTVFQLSFFILLKIIGLNVPKDTITSKEKLTFSQSFLLLLALCVLCLFGVTAIG